MRAMTDERKKRARPGRKSTKRHPGNPWPARLRSLRAKHGDGTRDMTQLEAADRAHVAVRTWISWENGHRRPSGPALQLLKLAFPEDFSDIG